MVCYVCKKKEVYFTFSSNESVQCFCNMMHCDISSGEKVEKSHKHVTYQKYAHQTELEWASKLKLDKIHAKWIRPQKLSKYMLYILFCESWVKSTEIIKLTQVILVQLKGKSKDPTGVERKGRAPRNTNCMHRISGVLRTGCLTFIWQRKGWDVYTQSHWSLMHRVLTEDKTVLPSDALDFPLTAVLIWSPSLLSLSF